MKKGLFLMNFILWLALPSKSQERPEINIQDFIENMFQVPDEDVNYEDLYESLYQLYTNPIDLNHTNKNELNSLYQLNINQVNSLLEYIENNYPLVSVYELQVIEGYDNATIEGIHPFVIVKPPGKNTTGNLAERIANHSDSYLLIRTERLLESQRGFLETDSSRFLGSPYKIYSRFRTVRSNDFSIGLTMEKDAGEFITWDNDNRQYGFDYYSFHLYLENQGPFQKIALGDYQMQFGQGLVVGSGFNPGKGAETITTVKRGNSGIRPYTSVLESGFMRGAAVCIVLGRDWQISPFYSRLRQDGNVRIGDSFDEYEEYISSIQNIGLHRNFSEINSRDQIIEQNAGLNITYNHTKSQNFQAGVTSIVTNFSTDIFKTPNNYNQFEFRGNRNHNLGIYANYNWQNFLFFGESAISKSGGMAHIYGLMTSLSPIISMSFLIRDYDKNYHSFYGNSFGEGSRNINESGMYWGVKVEPSRKFTLSAFYDRFRFPWLRYRVNAPSEGYEYLIKADFRPNKKLNFYFQYREQSKELSVTLDEENLSQLIAGIKRSGAANLDIKLNQQIGLKSRFQYSTYDFQERTTGMTLVQDLNLTFNKWKFSARYAIFDTEDYENRQYVYEKDVIYAFSIPAYAGQGNRSYLLIQYKLGRKLTFWLKYGVYNFRNINSIGSGLSEIQGKKKSELKFQLRLAF